VCVCVGGGGIRVAGLAYKCNLDCNKL
jgi:hypothetical protein